MYEPELYKIARTLSESPFPKKLAVEITAECNLSCSMCHHPAMKRPKGRIPFELWKKCADEVADVSPNTECWFSFIGEPLLEPELLFRVIAYGKSVGLRKLYVNSNGMMLTPDLANPLLDSGVDLIVFGLDGFASDTYERIRVGGERDVVYANVEYLLERKHARGDATEIQVQFIEMDENSHEIDEFSQYWLERGAVVKLRNKLSWGGKFDTPLCVPQEDRIACPWAMTQLHVFWDGRVPRCPGDTEGDEGVGNAWDDSLYVLWQRLGIYRDNHMQHRFDQLPDRCQECKDWMVGAARRIRPASERSAATLTPH
jgi:sulfatase maturation enzyme AslB (radical SAM superfamily)